MPALTHLDILEPGTGWQLIRSTPNAASTPAELDRNQAIDNAVVPGTVGSTLLGQYDPDKLSLVNYDDFDWWYECDFAASPGRHGKVLLRLDGLATIADVWLNDEKILSSRNMFTRHRVDITSLLRPRNQLAIVFRSLTDNLKIRRPRPRWKTRLVANQQLRWIRTTLLGRIPGWTPPIPAVGPWQPIALEHADNWLVNDASVVTRVERDTPRITIQLDLSVINAAPTPEMASIILAGQTFPLEVTRNGDNIHLHGDVAVPDVPLWWPHTHGTPNCHDYSIQLGSENAKECIHRGTVGFRDIGIDRRNGNLAIQVNGKPVFARGACWTTTDIVSLNGDAQRLRETLQLVQAAGANMIRVGGTMTYESDLFYAICDELGIMVWQDFMFANMDYPVDDDEFMADVALEIDQQLHRLTSHPCIAVFCGNSEVEQQAAMWGRPSAFWKNRLFYEIIPAAIEKCGAKPAYFPSSPCEGTLPFHNDTGISHYFGVGAYQRPVSDTRTAKVKFTTECLGFSNVPDAQSLSDFFGSPTPVVHHPRWKAGIPRDASAGWDFEDIRDYYLKSLYRIDPVELRYADKERYIALSQVVTGEVIQQAYAHWRHPDNACNGALIWFMQDLVPGAGWGIFDSTGRPKPLYYFLMRQWAAVSMALVDQGLNGLHGYVVNESSCDRQFTLIVELLQHSSISIAKESLTVTITKGGFYEYSVDQILDGFFDVTYSYRFGPPKHDVVVASLLDENMQSIANSAFFPNGHDLRVLDSAAVEHTTQTTDAGTLITLTSDCFLKNTCIAASGYAFSDNYFDLAPGLTKTTVATKHADTSKPLRLQLSASNLVAVQALR